MKTDIPLEQLKRQALAHSDKNYLDFANRKSILDWLVIVYMQRHPRSSMNSNVYNPSLEFCIHHQGHHFYIKTNDESIHFTFAAYKRHIAISIDWNKKTKNECIYVAEIFRIWLSLQLDLISSGITHQCSFGGWPKNT